MKQESLWEKDFLWNEEVL